MQIIDGKATAKEIKAEIKAEVDIMLVDGKRAPHLAAILVGHDGGSETYVAYKIKDCEEVGFRSTLVRFEEDVDEQILIDKIIEMNRDEGELNSVKKATFPLFAAVGGMVIPVILFLVLNNNNPETSRAWGIPMATDIAFSLAILKLLGNKVPLGLKIFLIAFAIVDDLGAVLVIAVFYSEEIKWGLIGIAMIMLAILFFLSSKKIYIWSLSLLFGAVIWILFLKSGIHPTIAGVLMAFTIPIRQKMDMDTYAKGLDCISRIIKDSGDPDSPLLSKTQIEEIDNLEDWTEKVQSPLQHLEHKLHNWVAFLIMPVFALSNSGVQIGGEGLDLHLSLSGNIAISLVAGKLLGVAFFSWLALKLKLAELPSGTSFGQIIGVALLAGVGFTMSIFVANLAFPEQQMLLDSSKVGILAGSLFAGFAGYITLRITLKSSLKS